MANYEISQEQTRRMQAIGLEMAVYFDEFCRKHGLTYFLCGGCCIGTARNGKFIPWDDDVDVFMPRADYQKLMELWQDTPRYSIQYTTRDFLTQNQFLTICDNETTFIKTYQKDLDINHGIVLDVLPLDGCPTGWRRKTQKIWALLYALFIVGKAPENHGKAVYGLGKLALALVPFRSWRYRVWKFCEKKMSQYPIDSCEYITELCSGPKAMQFEYPKKCFDHAVPMEFEGHMLSMPADYDTYLAIAFGDYMTPPPKEKQVNHHEYEFMDTEHSYRQYRGVKYFVRKN